MPKKIKSLDDLRKFKEKMEQSVDLREKGINVEKLVQVKVSMGTCGIASGARETFQEFIEVARDLGLKDIVLTQTGCMGYCHSEPTVEITKPNEEPVIFGDVKGPRVREIVEKYIVRGELVDGIIPTGYKTINE